MNRKPLILLVEDNEGDIVLTTQAFADANLDHELAIKKDGEEALQYLRKEGVFHEAKTPDLILLDINLPRIDGKEILKVIKNDEALKIIPVIILTTSNSENDMLDVYRNHANCFITKPTNFDRYIEICRGIGEFWFGIVQLPKSKQK